jgi:hypothetical protein
LLLLQVGSIKRQEGNIRCALERTSLANVKLLKVGKKDRSSFFSSREKNKSFLYGWKIYVSFSEGTKAKRRFFFFDKFQGKKDV